MRKLKNILTTILTLISLSSFGQEWIAYKVDSNLTLLVPENFETTDTLGQKVITGPIENGLILLNIIPNNTKPSFNGNNEKDLIEYYKGIRKGYVDSQNGNLIDEEIFEKNGLKFLRFSYKASMEDEKQIRHFVGLFVNERTYAINFWELEEKTEELSIQRAHFFSSLQFADGLTLKNQLNPIVDNSKAFNAGYMIGQTFGYTFLFGIIAFGITWLIRKIWESRMNTISKRRP